MLRKPKSNVTDKSRAEIVRLVFFEKNFMGDAPFMIRFLISYETASYEIALRRKGILSLKRPDAGKESCKVGFFFRRNMFVSKICVDDVFHRPFDCELLRNQNTVYHIVKKNGRANFAQIWGKVCCGEKELRYVIIIKRFLCPVDCFPCSYIHCAYVVAWKQHKASCKVRFEPLDRKNKLQ